MNNSEKFIKFLESLTTKENKSLVESIKQGFNVIIESEEGDYIDYSISKHYLPALFQGDYDGLSDEEVSEVEEFQKNVRSDIQNNGGSSKYHSDVIDEGDDNWGRCEISGKQSECATIRYSW
jgi:hypothetical protein